MRIAAAPAPRSALLFGLVLLACFGANAQTTPLQIATFTQEVTVPLTQIGAATQPTVPAAVLQSIQSGAQEIRQQVTFAAATRRLSVRTFLVGRGAPNPTPAAGQTNLLESYEVNIENVIVNDRTKVIVIIGTIAGNTTSPFGNIADRPFVYVFGYDVTATPARLNNITSVVGGSNMFFAVGSTGTLTFAGQAIPPGPGTGENRPPVVVATAGQNATTAQAEVQLDASGSSDPENAALTYAWRAIGKTAAIIDRNTAKPRVQFGEGFGEYIFEVTVTDDKGASAKAEVKVLYVGH
jgi:hypothetical protein